MGLTTRLIRVTPKTLCIPQDKQDQYDLIVLDPPAFAKHREARHQAVKVINA
jgi:hypothetical protein